ncbi:MAG: SCP2 sterol-binding domain-containing protein [Archangium sp.]|nr:SCP2 sterol-binding domain-containing protein [Archangium sp.]
MTQAKAWFERQLPALLVSRFDDFLAVQGDISFQVGDGAWTLTFGDVEEPVRQGATPGAKLRLKFTPPAFEAFVGGTLDPVAAIGKGDIKASGDFELLATLATLMMPLQRDLGWDAG